MPQARTSELRTGVIEEQASGRWLVRAIFRTGQLQIEAENLASACFELHYLLGGAVVRPREGEGDRSFMTPLGALEEGRQKPEGEGDRSFMTPLDALEGAGR